MTSGREKLSNGRVFCWMMSGTHIKEVYGSVEETDGRIISGSSGWWRTPDPEKATAAAEALYGQEALE